MGDIREPRAAEWLRKTDGNHDFRAMRVAAMAESSRVEHQELENFIRLVQATSEMSAREFTLQPSPGPDLVWRGGAGWQRMGLKLRCGNSHRSSKVENMGNIAEEKNNRQEKNKRT